MSVWAPTRSNGCFVYFEHGLADSPRLPRALLDALFGGLSLGTSVKVTSKPSRWKAYGSAFLQEVLADPTCERIALLVGTSKDVRLGGQLTLRLSPTFEAEFQSAPLSWFGAECERWPEAVVVPTARRWLRLAAELGAPLSGGVLAASDLRNAKVEMTHELESSPGEDLDRNPTPFYARIRQEKGITATWTKIRRVYPITLLGPKFAADVDVAQLRAAGAVDIEHVNGSLIFGTGTPMLEAWDPQYLEATRALRRLLWPIMAQNPADDPDAPRKGGRERRR